MSSCVRNVVCAIAHGTGGLLRSLIGVVERHDEAGRWKLRHDQFLTDEGFRSLARTFFLEVLETLLPVGAPLRPFRTV
jgi:hypothetical protein